MAGNSTVSRRQSSPLADEVADHLRLQIRTGGFKKGDRLPSEKDIGARYGVSRSVVREAIARLKTESILTSRQGSGVFVASPGGTFLRLVGETNNFKHLANLYELRCSIEVGAAGLAAIRRTKGDLARLKAALKAMTVPSTRAAADIEFHLAIADATRNELYRNIVAYLGGALADAISSAVRNTVDRHPGHQTRVDKEHYSIFTAIQESSAAKAELAMERHLHAAAERLALAGTLATKIERRD